MVSFETSVAMSPDGGEHRLTMPQPLFRLHECHSWAHGFRHDLSQTLFHQTYPRSDGCLLRKNSKTVLLAHEKEPWVGQPSHPGRTVSFPTGIL